MQNSGVNSTAAILTAVGYALLVIINIIIELNGIKDANLIYVGQKLLLPIDE